MKTILNIVYNDIVEDGSVLDKNEEYTRLSGKSADIYTQFDEIMDEEQKKKLNELWSTEAQLEYEAGLAYYKAGFKAGLLVAFECLKD